MIRLLPLLVGLAYGAPPPPSSDAPRFEGFHRVWVTPDAFADGLSPKGAPPIRPVPVEPEPEIEPERPQILGYTLVVSPQDLKDAGYTTEALVERLREMEGVARVEASSDGSTVLIEADPPEDALSALNLPSIGPDGTDAHVQIGALGTLTAVPDLRPRMLPRAGGPPRPQAIPRPEPGHDLRIQNPAGVKVRVKVNGTEVGELRPRATGVIRGVREGTYQIVVVGPTGFERRLEIETTPAGDE